MPILDLQRRMHQIGRIRLGQQVKTSGGKTRPSKLSTFRFTSQDDVALKAAADLFGGEPRRWEGAPTGEQWEVVTDANVIPVVVPPAATAFSQWYEQWSGGGCIRRCDGETELLSDSPCVCAMEDERTCTPHSRLNVILRDLPGIGVWRLDTSGFYAATELAGTVDVIMGAATRGQLLPAVLRLEERQVKRPGEAVKKFAVPVLDVQLTPAALGLVVGTAPPQQTLESSRQEIAATSWQPIPPQPATAELGPGVGDAIRDARTPAPKPRKNSAPPLPTTGIKPRGLGTGTTPPVEDEETALTDPTLSDAQMRKLRALYGAVGVTTAARQKEITATLLNVDKIATHSNLTVDQASHIIDLLTKVETSEAKFTINDDAEVTGIEVAEPDLFTDPGDDAA